MSQERRWKPGGVKGAEARMHNETGLSGLGPRPVLTPLLLIVSKTQPCPCARKTLHTCELPAKEQILMRPHLTEAEKGAHVMGGRDESTGSVTVTAPYVDLTSISSHPVSSLWFGRPSQRTGPGGGPAGRSGAEAATCQARQLQHRGAAGGGRLGGTLPRQGACAELRTYPYEHCECPLVLGLGGWVGTHQDWSVCRVSLRLGVFSVDSRESLFAL